METLFFGFFVGSMFSFNFLASLINGNTPDARQA